MLTDRDREALGDALALLIDVAELSDDEATELEALADRVHDETQAVEVRCGLTTARLSLAELAALIDCATVGAEGAPGALEDAGGRDAPEEAVAVRAWVTLERLKEAQRIAHMIDQALGDLDPDDPDADPLGWTSGASYGALRERLGGRRRSRPASAHTPPRQRRSSRPAALPPTPMSPKGGDR